MNGGPEGAESIRPAPGFIEASSGVPVLQSPLDAMNGEMLQRKVIITNPLGFHLRPQTAFAQLAQKFQSTVTMRRDDQRINGKSVWELMLFSVPQGTEVVVEVQGPDAQAALDALTELLAAPTVDDDEPLPPKG